MIARLTPFAVALALAGCAIGPDYVRPASPLPTNYAEAAATAPAAVDAQWWRLFDDAQLNALVDQALANNSDLRQAIARVEQADALAREAGAAFLPEIDGSAGISNSKASTRTATFVASQPVVRHARSAALSTSYELDLWGRVRRSNEAIRASLLSSQYARDAVRLSVAGLVAADYLALRATDAQLAVSGQTVASREESLKLVGKRIAAGLAGPLDGYQAESALAAARAQRIEQRRQRALLAHRLALLTGQPELSVAPGDLRSLPLPPQPPAGLPSDLIEGRPDIRRAEADLVAANAGIGVAKAGYFPKFTLTGSVGSESKLLADLFTGGAGTWAAGIGALVPILDFGRTAARVDQAEAVNQQSLIAWQNALQVAYKEVRDALVSLREDGEAEAAQQSRLANAEKAFELSNLRYSAGLTGYLEVLDAQRTLNDAQLAMISTRQARLTAAVDLFKALGGGWRPAAL